MIPAARQERQAAARQAMAKLRRPEFCERTERWLDAQIYDGLSWRDAALQVGLKLKTARRLLSAPHIQRSLHERALTVRTVEGARNVPLLVATRDRGFSSEASAAQQKVSLEAARLLEGDKGQAGGINVQIGVGVQVGGIIGYVVDLSEPDEGGGRPVPPSSAPVTIDMAAGGLVAGPDRLSSAERIRREAVDADLEPEPASRPITAPPSDGLSEAERVNRAAADPAGTRRPIWDGRDVGRGFGGGV